MMQKASDCVQNLDRDIWRAAPGDYYADRIFVTPGEGIGIDVGGTCIVRPVRTWHKMEAELDSLRIRNSELEEGIKKQIEAWRVEASKELETDNPPFYAGFNRALLDCAVDLELLLTPDPATERKEPNAAK